MLSARTLVAALALAVAIVMAPASAFAPANGNSRPTTSLAVIGPKQAATMERLKNPAKFESTIQGLMAQKGLTRGQAEKRYGEFLADPDGFALKAAEEQRREKGYKDWIEQAMANSDDPEETLRRIKEFQKVNSLKGTAIMIILGAFGIYYNSVNPYIPPGH
mmetsp:Transcript_19801/g.46862  ORF Transcript_19801/g.46862 Transcript_19801/m.46862 type:complete len:162 (-) Transcript_19801:217-702(-)